jgi:hypothetical protein
MTDARASRARPTTAAPTSASPSYSGPALRNGQCPYLTTGQIQAALGQTLQHLAGCAYSFAKNASLAVTSQTYNSAQSASTCYRQSLTQAKGLFPGPGFTVTAIPGLGPDAVSLTLPDGGTQAVMLQGTKVLAVFVLWPPAQTRPQIAVTLLREAARNFGRYTTPVTLAC